ncbi:MAG: hypothetical protein EB167_03695 [Nitrososphaeria archaeon]|nr:hypothetical protein [Nitrososphaeria archaeon]NDF47892.1 hypothetical protein [Nitrosopumilaceae archaeon]
MPIFANYVMIRRCIVILKSYLTDPDRKIMKSEDIYGRTLWSTDILTRIWLVLAGSSLDIIERTCAI